MLAAIELSGGSRSAISTAAFAECLVAAHRRGRLASHLGVYVYPCVAEHIDAGAPLSCDSIARRIGYSTHLFSTLARPLARLRALAVQDLIAKFTAGELDAASIADWDWLDDLAPRPDSSEPTQLGSRRGVGAIVDADVCGGHMFGMRAASRHDTSLDVDSRDLEPVAYSD